MLFRNLIPRHVGIGIGHFADDVGADIFWPSAARRWRPAHPHRGLAGAHPAPRDRRYPGSANSPQRSGVAAAAAGPGFARLTGFSTGRGQSLRSSGLGTEARISSWQLVVFRQEVKAVRGPFPGASRSQ